MIFFFKKYTVIIGFFLLIVTFIVSLCFGSVFINVFCFQHLDAISKEILLLRIDRALTALVAGGALSIAGLGYQAVLRNPLAEPFILGISGGASIGAALAILLGLSSLCYFSIPIFAFSGAIIVLFLVLVLSRGSGTEYSDNIMLSGIIVGTICSSILIFIISMFGIGKLDSITWWMLGNLQPESVTYLIIVAISVVLGCTILSLYGRHINVISMGEELSYFFGVSYLRITLVTLIISSILTALVVSLTGIIGFVGLIIPNILRRICGANHRKLFPLAMIYGGLFLIICDTIGRTVASPQIIPIGVITALIGGPVFIWILNKRRLFF